ncbi:MAG: hypothetical protein V4615_10740 [Bacteroidota bacterium]
MRHIIIHLGIYLQKKVAPFIVFLFSAGFLQASINTSVYVSAHQDDWQLFMGVNAYNDIVKSSDSSRVLIVYVTAGDYSDCLTTSDTQPVPYFLAREQGAKNSVELAANTHKQRYEWENDTVKIHGHLLLRSSYKFITCYFLRLADGAIDGQRNLSLRNFRKNRFANNYSIDSLTRYTNWNDLSTTCSNILEFETKNSNEIFLNLFDTSYVYNPNDHSDHYETALIFLNASNTMPVKRLVYEGYNSGNNRAANLKNLDIMKESALFAAYNQAMIDNNYPSIWNNDYIRFCDKNYFRLVSVEPQTETPHKKSVIGMFILLTLVISLFYYSVLTRK